MNDLVAEREVTLDRVEEIFKDAVLTTERDGARLYVSEDGVNVLFRINPDRARLSMLSAWPFRHAFPDDEKLVFANSLNNWATTGRFAMPDSTGLVCDHYILFNDGLDPVQLVGTVKRFVSICHAVLGRDSAGMLGTD